MKLVLKSASAACALLCLAALPAAHAQTSVLSKVNQDVVAGKAKTAEYWTAERFAAAKPLPLPLAKSGAKMQGEEALSTLQAGEPASSPAQAPAIEPVPAVEQLFTPGSRLENLIGEATPTPQDRGTFRADFTSTRVTPLFDGTAAQYSADRSYPYRTVGILFFSINNQPYLCSASLINRRVIATAGHCVHSGSGGTAGFYSDWVFIPAYRDGTAPFLRWNWRQVTVTNTWATGGGGVPNAADYAMIVLGDQPVVRGGPPVRIGAYLGWLGWQTLDLFPNHTSKLGYPCNLDNCGKMQNVTSQSSRRSENNNVEYGSDARGGSSGGPWVKNFGITAVGGATGLNRDPNRVVGVTSYGYVETEPKVQGAAIPDNRWVAVWNAVCAGAGNCTP
jgi:V8-like Glu-specific endopeptidase